MNPTILVSDLDSTATEYDADFHAGLLAWGHPAGLLSNAPDEFGMVERGWFETREQFIEHHHRWVKQGGFARMTPAPGFREAIIRLRGEGVKVLFATHRLITGDDALEISTTEEWFDHVKVEHDGLFFTGLKYEVVGDVYADDAPHVISTLVERDLEYIIADRPYNQGIAGARFNHWGTELVPQVLAINERRLQVPA